MAAGWQQQHGTLQLRDQSVHWARLKKTADVEQLGSEGAPLPLILLHGAGVSGAVTWGGFLPHFTHYTDIVIPDLRGAGKTHFPSGDERAFTMDEVLDDLEALMREQGIERFDVAGYSFGGLAAMLLKARLGDRINRLTLLEPALLERMDREASVRIREHYTCAASAIREGRTAEEGITQFLDLIAPKRSRDPRVESVAIKRLGRRHEGFAHALDCVTQAIKHTDREALLARQGRVLSVVGGRSPHAMREYHHYLGEAYPAWRYVELSETDHSLPFQKPRQLVELIERR
ncbi:alpha/beta fold hydrolase [Larsenimonas suaedae]|uniref:Alpha/beta hydrolase n=1 Tax=Larsenimonas suaedae TaxID=1851019 RepID=A0ABU1GZ68_9GAMM|nr:alpha/beta hydrolase [Larsenimonas suaedae]MDR5896856.1 alpha/beta hydrolase [Larsenimonas suaedae]